MLFATLPFLLSFVIVMLGHRSLPRPARPAAGGESLFLLSLDPGLPTAVDGGYRDQLSLPALDAPAACA